MREQSQVTLPLGFMSELARAKSQQEVLSATAKWMPQIVAAERSSIALPHDGISLSIYALAGSLIIPRGTLLKIEGSLVGHAYTTQQIVNVGDLATSKAQEASVLVDAGMLSALVCPITAAGRCLGTVNLGNKERNYFTEQDELMLRSVVDLIASFLSVHQHARVEHERANTDHLTRSLSRRGILNHLDREFETAEGNPSLLYLDVDGFKAINDLHGHLVGDNVLRAIALRISTALRDCDRVGRLGGDEFLVVLQDDPDGQTARRIADVIDAALSVPIVVGSVSVRSSVSIGLASIEGPASTASELLHDADQALGAAKTSDLHFAVADQALRDHSTMVATIDRDLDQGMSSGAITFHYQPIHDLATREVMGAEALIRWTHPRLGAIPAPLIIERLETTGRVEAFTRWALATIVEHWTLVRTELPWFHDKAVSINLSPRQLAWDGYADLHAEALKRSGFRPQDIIVEVVESMGIHPGDVAEATLRKLGALGVIIALDDFGTGHNALSYFTMFPVHAVKLDRSLVSMADNNDTVRTILTSLASMLRDLGVTSLGEGVETEAEASACAALGIVHGQGWHFGRPASLESFVDKMRIDGPVKPYPLAPLGHSATTGLELRELPAMF